MNSILDALSAPRRALWGGVSSLLGAETPESGAELMGRMGMDPESTMAKVLGFGAEVVTDPLTWVGGALLGRYGAGAARGMMGKSAVPAAAEAAPAVAPKVVGGADEALAAILPKAGNPHVEKYIVSGMKDAGGYTKASHAAIEAVSEAEALRKAKELGFVQLFDVPLRSTGMPMGSPAMMRGPMSAAANPLEVAALPSENPILRQLGEWG